MWSAPQVRPGTAGGHNIYHTLGARGHMHDSSFFAPHFAFFILCFPHFVPWSVNECRRCTAESMLFVVPPLVPGRRYIWSEDVNNQHGRLTIE
jgi:hypothetical protein